jgi:hypothetical protein
MLLRMFRVRGCCRAGRGGLCGESDGSEAKRGEGKRAAEWRVHREKLHCDCVFLFGADGGRPAVREDRPIVPWCPEILQSRTPGQDAGVLSPDEGDAWRYEPEEVFDPKERGLGALC